MKGNIDLVKRACVDDAQNFEQIVEANKKKIFYLAYDLTGSVEDAEDLSQEVFLKAFRSLQSFKGEASLSSWLYRITLNAFLDRKRKLSFRMEKEHRELEEEMAAHSPFTAGTDGDLEPGMTPEDHAQSMQIRMHIDAALAQLSPRERAVFVMRHYREMPGKEVGKLLNISEGTVKTLLFRGIKKLQKLLSHYDNSRAMEVQR